jgi:proteasome lid subunit RPN8/RPN11
MTFASAVLDALEAHAREAWPDECCGLLLEDGSGTVMALAPLPNRATEPGRGFAIEPGDLEAAAQSAAAAGLRIAGLYHSHPGASARLSAEDRHALVCPWWRYVVVALPARDGRAEIAAYDSALRPEAVQSLFRT